MGNDHHKTVHENVSRRYLCPSKFEYYNMVSSFKSNVTENKEKPFKTEDMLSITGESSSHLFAEVCLITKNRWFTF